MLFDKKYPAIVLTQAHMLAFHYMQEGLRFILTDEMERILHMTMDSSRGSSDEYGYKYLSTEYGISLILKNGKVLPVMARIKVHFKDGEWTIGLGGDSRICFTFKIKKEKGGYIESVFKVDCTNGKFLLLHFTLFHPDGKIDILEGAKTPNDASLIEIKRLFLEE